MQLLLETKEHQKRVRKSIIPATDVKQILISNLHAKFIIFHLIGLQQIIFVNLLFTEIVFSIIIDIFKILTYVSLIPSSLHSLHLMEDSNVVDFAAWGETPIFNLQKDVSPYINSISPNIIPSIPRNQQFQQLENPPYESVYETSSQNRLGFFRSFKYLNKLLSLDTYDQSDSNYSDQLPDPLRGRSKQVNIAKGLFCANRECCSVILDGNGRSPYCSKQCQIREQNMRQNRVKYREALIRRKQALFAYLARIKEEDFERDKIGGIVGAFLGEYAKEFGEF
ncbi:Conserved_hypothetical protein [Hexamita inflata]|uniref:Uncharacterized protein n=1 Tax=Hexamita inflata TaxID=28002 RepID=A0ABP1KUA8_9EUKA